MIKPIDMQVIMPNVQRLSHDENSKKASQEMNMTQGHIEEEKEEKIRENSVNQLKDKDKLKLRDNKGNKKNNNKKNDKDRKNKKEKKYFDDHLSFFDIKV